MRQKLEIVSQKNAINTVVQKNGNFLSGLDLRFENSKIFKMGIKITVQLFAFLFVLV